DRFAHVLWEAATSAFSLERWVAEKKFGPHFVVAKTPIANIRLTTFFARCTSVGARRGRIDHPPRNTRGQRESFKP
ncbi:MAG TPA: hypothetical protein VMO26_16735, partial [Vicinamibacterales bacterium]|nr:hypothetical protein [Vicinamibacterales bacterium]